MSTQVLLDKIAAERDATIAQIEAQTAETVSAIETATAAEVAAVTTAAAAAREKDVAQMKRAALSKARQAGKLLVQTARRQAFDEVIAAAEAAVVNNDASHAQRFADMRADLEMDVAKQLG